MKSFFEELGKKIGETTETVTSKAGEMMEIQRLRGQIRTLERGNEADMQMCIRDRSYIMIFVELKLQITKFRNPVLFSGKTSVPCCPRRVPATCPWRRI